MKNLDLLTFIRSSIILGLISFARSASNVYIYCFSVAYILTMCDTAKYIDYFQYIYIYFFFLSQSGFIPSYHFFRFMYSHRL